MAHEHLINARAYEQTLAFIDDFHLAEHDPVIARTLAALRPDSPHPLNRKLFDVVSARCARFTAFHDEYPFVTAPAAALSEGEPFVLRQYANNLHLCITDEEENRGVCVIGSSGSGKTALVLQFADRGLRRRREWIVDGKGDGPGLTTRHPSLYVFSGTARVDLFAKPSWLSTPEFIALLMESIARTMYLGQTGKSILHEALTLLFREHESPTLSNLIAILERMPQKGDTYDRLNAIRNTTLRMRRLAERYPGLAGRGGVPLHELCDKSVLWSFTSYTDVEDLILTLGVTMLFHHHRHRDIRALQTVIHVDEALLAFRAENSSRINGNPLSELVGLTREYGIGWRLSVNTLSLLDAAVIANTFVLIALNVNSGTELQAVTRTFGLTTEQADYYAHRLTRGQALVRLGDRWRNVMLCTYDKLPFSKSITASAWEEAAKRIERLAAREGETGQPPTAKPSASASHASAAPLIKPEIALNIHAEALLTHAAREGVAITTEAFRNLTLHPQAGTRAKKQLLDLALIEEERITIRRGRGGTAVAIRPTASGYQRAGVKRRSTRGGDSIQHEWLVRQLANRLKGARIDALAGKKACDILIAYTDTHQPLATCCGLAPENGALIAIEVEVSDPRRTAPRNIERNAEAGVAHTIIATTTPLQRNGTPVVDIFELLEAL